MKNYTLFFLLVSITISQAATAKMRFAFLNSTIEIIDSTEAAGIIGKDDGYMSNFSLFDIKSKLNDPAATERAAYLPYAAKQVRNWPAAEQHQLQQSFNEVAAFVKAQALTLNLPAVIHIIKTTANEEYGAEGYTRTKNIMLNTSTNSITPGIIAHELFHVFSRYNEKKRDALYQIFGFKKCNPIALNPALENKYITNPDCPVISHYITANNQDMTLLLYSSKPYTGGSVFEAYVKIGLLVLDGSGSKKQPKVENGKPVIKEIADVPEVLAQVGTNSSYLLHPEEICADNFSKMVTGTDVPQPEYLAKMKKVLKK